MYHIIKIMLCYLKFVFYYSLYSSVTRNLDFITYFMVMVCEKNCISILNPPIYSVILNLTFSVTLVVYVVIKSCIVLMKLHCVTHFMYMLLHFIMCCANQLWHYIDQAHVILIVLLLHKRCLIIIFLQRVFHMLLNILEMEMMKFQHPINQQGFYEREQPYYSTQFSFVQGLCSFFLPENWKIKMFPIIIILWIHVSYLYVQIPAGKILLININKLKVEIWRK